MSKREQIGTRAKILDTLKELEDLIGIGGGGRGRSQKSLDLIDAMAEIAKAAQPITGRGIGYKLFTAGLISSMSRTDMKRVYRLLKIAREEGTIPWHWIVDEARELERTPSWNDPEEFAEAAALGYRRDFWSQQPERCEVWSEKGTLRGVLQPVLDHYGVGFRVMHGFSSATVVHEIAVDRDRRPLTALYVGDFDPSGMFMSERDLPDRLKEYGGDHVTVLRIALRQDQLSPLPSFPASDKRKDPRYKWFVESFGDRCWEIDALDPNALRDRVEGWVRACIEDRDGWERCEQINEAERESLKVVLRNWALPGGGPGGK
jgi:hypothetical protein